MKTHTLVWSEVESGVIGACIEGMPGMTVAIITPDQEETGTYCLSAAFQSDLQDMQTHSTEVDELKEIAQRRFTAFIDWLRED